MKRFLYAAAIVAFLAITIAFFGFKKPAGQNYIVVTATSTFELESTVSFRQAGGYACVGGVSSFLDRGRVTFIQAMER